jgi:hypothetical protein
VSVFQGAEISIVEFSKNQTKACMWSYSCNGPDKAGQLPGEGKEVGGQRTFFYVYRSHIE